MSKFRITYPRLKSAGSIQFDNDLEFVKTIEIPASSPEDATQWIARKEPYLAIVRVEMV
jgi:hypothetical protein